MYRFFIEQNPLGEANIRVKEGIKKLKIALYLTRRAISVFFCAQIKNRREYAMKQKWVILSNSTECDDLSIYSVEGTYDEAYDYFKSYVLAAVEISTSLVERVDLSKDDMTADIYYSDHRESFRILSVDRVCKLEDCYSSLKGVENMRDRVIFTNVNNLYGKDVVDKLLQVNNDCLSKSDTYQYSIDNFKDYNLGLVSKEDMRMLLNILEAHGETLEDIGDYTSYAFTKGYAPCITRMDAAEFWIETNAFFNGWNSYVEFLSDGNESLEELKEEIIMEIDNSDLVITTDGLVERNVV